MLLRRLPSPVTELNRAVALRYVVGAEPALREVDALAPRLDGYHLFHAVRADMLAALGQRAEAQRSETLALRLTQNPAEQSLLRRRLAGSTC
jgi:RNA polymerase sigma-70 factor (ECF subfamily)